MSGKLETTSVGQMAVRISKAINRWFENKVFFALCLVFFAAAYSLSLLDTTLHEITSQIVPDNRFNYTEVEIQSYVESLGDSIFLYRNYLIVELLAAFTICSLASFTISFFGFILVRAEEDMCRELSEKGVPPPVFPFRATLLNLLPILIFSFEVSENLCLMMSLYTKNSIFLQNAGIITRYKWICLRFILAFITMVFIQGWGRVIGHRWTYRATPKPSSQQGKINQIPKGLYKARNVGAETFKNK
jgi:amino acid permease